jgi:hypothetical protein
LKTRPKQLLGSLPLDIVLPGLCGYGTPTLKNRMIIIRSYAIKRTLAGITKILLIKSLHASVG